MRQTIVRVTAAALFAVAGTSCAPLGQLLGTEFNAEPGRALSLKPCPPMPEYSEKEQAAAFWALTQALESGGYGATVLDQIVDDYKRVRVQCQ